MPPLTLLLVVFGLTCSQVLAEDEIKQAIIGGDYVRHHFKYHVSLSYGKLHCGGTIIAEQYILTAAHCVTKGGIHITDEPIRVIAGTYNINDLQQAIIETAESVYIHKEYDPKTDTHDIAILKLNKALDLKHHANKIEKIDLPKRNYNLDNVNAVIAGFGLQSINVKKNKAGHLEEMGGTSDGKLKYANVKILTHQHCVDAYHKDEVHEFMFCGQVHQRHKQHNEGMCNGDSGGGLVHGHEVVGILSESPIGCNEAALPAIYTRLGPYLKMVNNIIHGKPENGFTHR